jgi:hypothetical protein
VVTAGRTGIESTIHVRGIFKHCTSYKLTQEAKARSAQVELHVAPAKN